MGNEEFVSSIYKNTTVRADLILQRHLSEASIAVQGCHSGAETRKADA